MISSRKFERRFASAVVASVVALLSFASAAHATDPSYAWAIRGGGTGNDYARGVSALADGSIIITGEFSGSATFGDTTLTSSAGSVDSFTAKVNADGSYAWAIKGGGDGNAYARGVSVLADGSSIITGSFYGSATFGTTTLTSTGSYDTFTAKVNANGSYAWATQSGGTGNASAHGVSALADGSSIIAGEFSGTATFGDTTLISTGSVDSFTAKVNADGSYAWAIKAGGTGSDYAFASEVSALADGSSIITGFFNGTATFEGIPSLTSTGTGDAFTAKVNANGSYAWAIKGGGSGYAVASGVSALPDGSSIITGFFDGTAIFGDTTPLISDGSYDSFTARVNADGSYAWAIQGGGTGSDAAYGVSALADGSSIITGQFSGIATFGATILTSEAGSIDTFTAKVNANGSYAWAIKGGGTGNASAIGVSALADGSSIITGPFNGIATFGATILTSTGGSDTFTARILADAPQAPTGASASAGIREATISWNAVAGGSVSSYTATAAPGGASCTAVAPAVTCTITNLTAGTSYSATVTATNPQGTSPPSQASNAVTPTNVLFNLAVSKSGTGGGTVTSSPAGIDCGSDCSETLVDGTSVTLTASPAAGSSFTAWSGSGCSGTSTCTVTMSEARAVDAKFTKKPSNVFPTPTVKAGASALSSTVRVPGPGTITQRVTRSSTAAAVLTVCKTSAKATKAGWVKLTCKLSKATRAALRQRSLRVSMKTTFTPTGGLPASKTQVVTLKSQRPPPYTG